MPELPAHVVTFEAATIRTTQITLLLIALIVTINHTIACSPLNTLVCQRTLNKTHFTITLRAFGGFVDIGTIGYRGQDRLFFRLAQILQRYLQLERFVLQAFVKRAFQFNKWPHFLDVHVLIRLPFGAGVYFAS